MQTNPHTNKEEWCLRNLTSEKLNINKKNRHSISTCKWEIMMNSPLISLFMFECKDLNKEI